MIVTTNCNIIRTESGVIVNPPISIDVATLDPPYDPLKKDLDIHRQNNMKRFEYAMESDRINAFLRIKLLYEYAIGEEYDFLLTSDWGFSSMNPEWGVINIWNTHIKNIPSNGIRLLFCVPLSHSIGFSYKYFRNYLVGQPPINEDAPKPHQKPQKPIVVQNNTVVEKKIRALLWGLCLADSAPTVEPEAASEFITAPRDVGADSILGLLTLRSIGVDSHIISVPILAKCLVEWANRSWPPIKNDSPIDALINYTITHKEYLDDPQKTAVQIYSSKSSYDAPQVLISMTAVSGIFKNWKTILGSAMRITWPDKGLIVAASVVAAMVNHLWNDTFVSNRIFEKIKKQMCEIILGSNKNDFNNVNLNQQFDRYWMAAINYKNQIRIGLESYIKYIVAQNHLQETSIFYPMMLGMIVMLDMQSNIKTGQGLIRDIWNSTIEESLNDMFDDSPLDLHTHLERDYYFNTVEMISREVKNRTAVCVCGVIAGIGCWNNLYNTTVEDPPPQYQVRVQQVPSASWIHGEIESFVTRYIQMRNKALGR
jgi:hypothetical protein